MSKEGREKDFDTFTMPTLVRRKDYEERCDTKGIRGIRKAQHHPMIDTKRQDDEEEILLCEDVIDLSLWSKEIHKDDSDDNRENDRIADVFKRRFMVQPTKDSQSCVSLPQVFQRRTVVHQQAAPPKTPKPVNQAKIDSRLQKAKVPLGYKHSVCLPLMTSNLKNERKPFLRRANSDGIASHLKNAEKNFDKMETKAILMYNWMKTQSKDI